MHTSHALFRHLRRSAGGLAAAAALALAAAPAVALETLPS
jgi:hypothetical protein